MKMLKPVLAALALAVFITPKPVLALAVMTVDDLGTTAPTTYTYAQTRINGSGTPPANNTGASNKTPGETFTLSSVLPPGDTEYELTSISIKDNASGMDNTTGLTWVLTIGTVSGSTFTAIDTETASDVSIGLKDYATMTLSDFVTLTPGTEYAFFLSTTGAVHIDGSNSPSFSGDISGNSAQVNGSDAVTTGSGSRTFYLETVAVPEPADWALLPLLGTLAFFGIRHLKPSSAKPSLA